MLDDFVHVASTGPPESADDRRVDGIAAMTVSHADCRAALVRVLDENHIHLYRTTTKTTCHRRAEKKITEKSVKLIVDDNKRLSSW